MQPIIVSGLGRCGTSMMMQMLKAGGADVWGEPPYIFQYPPPHQTDFPDHGKPVFKAFGTHLDKWKCLPEAKVIWMYRVGREQAKSYRKWMFALTGIHYDLEAVTSELESAWRKCSEVLEQSDVERIGICYDDVLADPWATAEQIAAFTGLPLDIKAMIQAVHVRTPGCLSTLEISEDAMNVMRAQYREALRAA